MRVGIVLLLLSPLLAGAADATIGGSGSGVYALVGSFLGQLAGIHYVRKELRAHEERCRAYVPPLANLGPDRG